MRFSRQSLAFMGTEALYGLAMGMLGFALNLYMQQSGLSGDWIGFAQSANIFCMGALAIPVSLLARRAGRKPLLLLGLGIEALAAVAFVFSRSPFAFLAGQGLLAIGLILVEATEIQVIYQNCATHAEQTTVFSCVFAIYTGFYGLGTLISGALANALGDFWRYRLVLLFVAALLLLECALRFLLLTERRTPRVVSAEKAKHSWLRAGVVALLLGLPLSQGLAISLITPFQNLFVQLRVSDNDMRIAWLLTLVGVANFACSLLTPILARRLRTRAAFLFAFALNVLLSLVLMRALPPALFSVGFVLRGGASILLNNLIDSQVFAILPDDRRDFFAGGRSLLRSAGGSAAALITGWFLQRGNAMLPFGISAAVYAFEGLFFFGLIWPRIRGAFPQSHNHKEEEPHEMRSQLSE